MPLGHQQGQGCNSHYLVRILEKRSLDLWCSPDGVFLTYIVLQSTVLVSEEPYL